MSENESFLNEVTEEVRKDQMIAFLRRNGLWIGLGVAVIVGGAAVNEYIKASARAEAQARGSAIWDGLEAGDAAARSAALAAVDLGDQQSGRIRDLHLATAMAEEGDRSGSLELLRAIVADQNASAPVRDLARLKLVIQGADILDADERLDILSIISGPGHPFRRLALEQQALILIETGDTTGATEILTTLVDDPDAGQAARGRADQLLTILDGGPGADGG